MRVSATLRIDNIDIETIVSIQLPECYKELSFDLNEQSNPIVIDAFIDISIPVPNSSNVYLIYDDNCY